MTIKLKNLVENKLPTTQEIWKVLKKAGYAAGGTRSFQSAQGRQVTSGSKISLKKMGDYISIRFRGVPHYQEENIYDLLRNHFELDKDNDIVGKK